MTVVRGWSRIVAAIILIAVGIFVRLYINNTQQNEEEEYNFIRERQNTQLPVNWSPITFFP